MLVEEAGGYGNDILLIVLDRILKHSNWTAHRITVGLANGDKILKFHA